MSDATKPLAVRHFGVKEMVPTLNGTGFMFEVRDHYADEGIARAAGSADPVLEIGCAYGVATIPALTAGARVVACDMEPRHLEILASRVAPSLRGRLSCVTGAVPDIEFEPAQFGAILCSRCCIFFPAKRSTSPSRKWPRG